jgi:hypothetical protein
VLPITLHISVLCSPAPLMADYKQLSQNEEDVSVALLGESEERASVSQTLRTIRCIACALLAVNVGLAFMSGYTSISVNSSLTKILPVVNPRVLQQPDQYVGLPESSRWKSACIYYKSSRPPDSDILRPTSTSGHECRWQPGPSGNTGG